MATVVAYRGELDYPTSIQYNVILSGFSPRTPCKITIYGSEFSDVSDENGVVRLVVPNYLLQFAAARDGR